MRKLVLVVTALTLTFVAEGQQLLHSAKYYVNALVLYRRLPGSKVEQVVNKWSVKMMLITNQDGMQVYRATGNQYYRQAVGAPVYQLRNVVYGKHYYNDGVSTELYGAAYRGDIMPPANLVRDPSDVVVAWASAVTEGNALKVLWVMDEKAGRRGTPVMSRGTYRLTFYCTPIDN
jgi:hypothetical protein